MPFLQFHRRGQAMVYLDLEEVIPTKGPWIVGRRRGHYIVPEAGIASVQFQIEREGEAMRLTDLSGDKTEVDGTLVESVLLQDGAVIKLGGFALIFQAAMPEAYSHSSAAGRQTLADAFAQPELPKALWVTAQPKGGGAPLRSDFAGSLTIGSGKDCALKLSGDTVSAHHVELTRRDGVVCLRDLGSTNGTWIGALRVIDVDIPLGARFRVGDWELWISGPDGARAGAAKPAMTAGGLVTADPAVLALLQQVDAIAHSNCPVLILGETGTGKELLAKAVHERSRRAAKRLVTVNCGLGRSAENLATELFGHADHAFTGAGKATPGTIGGAEGGTVFFDELKELPLSLQPTLLRVVGEGEIQPLGASEPRHVDVRFIAATHHDLVQAIRDGEFREDLYWRFALVKLELPPLRHRKGDIPILWDHLTQKLGGLQKPLEITEEALKKLMDHDWPGNVRELWNVINRVLLFTPGIVCEASAIVFDESLAEPEPAAAREPAPPGGENPPSGDVAVQIAGKTLAQIEAAVISTVMMRLNGNRSEACRQLKVDRKTLLRKLKEYRLEDVGVGEQGADE